VAHSRIASSRPLPFSVFLARRRRRIPITIAMLRPNPPSRRLALSSLLLLCACSGNELVGVHIALAKDGSGVLTTRSLLDPRTASPTEARAQGVTWGARAALHCVQGRFQQLANVRLGDGGLRFSASLGDEMPRLRTYVQRGVTAEWMRALVPDQVARRAMAKVYDPTGKTNEIGDAIRLEVTLPGDVVSSGVQPSGRGVEATHERNRAYLIVPVKTAQEAGDELIWDVSWR
jgi:hypothetical protein